MACGRYFKCPAGDLAHNLLEVPIVRRILYISVADVYSPEGVVMSSPLSVMSNAGISPIDLLWADHHRLARAPTSTTYENWVAAGKPCLRQNCGHRHGNHIPSEDMECDECQCLGFVGFGHPDDSGARPAIKKPEIPETAPSQMSWCATRAFALD
jgi:hypothetical protein